MEPGISMITLGVNDLEKSVKFYKEGLGFPQMDSPPEVAFFTLNGSWLGLYARDSLAEDAMVLSMGSGFKAFTLSHNVDSENEVDEIIENAVIVGSQLSKAPQKTTWGGFSGYLKDPDGNLWEVVFNPFFWIGPKDENI